MNTNKSLTTKISNQGKKYNTYKNNITKDVFKDKYNYLLDNKNSLHNSRTFENMTTMDNSSDYDPSNDYIELENLKNQMDALIIEYKKLNNAALNDIKNNINSYEKIQSSKNKNDKLKNVYVSKISDSNTSFLGCYNDTSNRALSTFYENNIYDFESCKKSAIYGGFKYFGLQNINSNGLSQCGMTNDLTSATMYGPGINYVVNTLWSVSSGSDDNISMVLQNSGDIFFYNQSNTLVNKLTTIVGSNSTYDMNFVNNCNNGGIITNVNATYGFNCNTNGYPSTQTFNVKSNNVGPIISDATKDKSQYLYNVGVNNNGVWEDPAPGCLKNFQLSYNCGTTIKVLNLPESPCIDQQPVLLDCSDVANTCKTFLILQDDGNLVIYQGSDPYNKGPFVFTTYTQKTPRVPNPNYVASKGKTGVNWLSSGSGLMPGEWIGSNDGSIYLKMNTNGNLELFVTVSSNDKCNKLSDGTYAGTSWSNSVYEILDNTNSNVLGKVGYVDKDLNLKEYPENMLTPGFDYTTLNKYDNVDNNISGYDPLLSVSVGDCKLKCNSISECYGFSYDNVNKSCYLKNSNMYPKSALTPNSDYNLYVRKPVIKNNYKNSYNSYIKYDINGGDMNGNPIPNSSNSSCETACNNNSLCAGYVFNNETSECYLKNNIDKNNIKQSNSSDLYIRNIELDTCSKNIEDITTNKWSQYTLSSELMSPETKCNVDLLDSDTKEKINDLNMQINDVYKKITDKINYLKSKNIQINDQYIYQTNKFLEYTKEIDDIKNKNKILAKDYTTSSMLNDSDLTVLQTNYKFTLFGVLAVIIIIGTMSQMRK